MKSQSQDGGKKQQRQRQQQIKILYRARTRRIVCEMTYRDYDTLRLWSKITEERASFFRCLETGFEKDGFSHQRYIKDSVKHFIS